MAHLTLAQQITQVESQLDAANTSLTDLMTHGAQSYTQDTGQTRQTVQRVNATELRRTIDSLENKLSMLEKKQRDKAAIGGVLW